MYSEGNVNEYGGGDEQGDGQHGFPSRSDPGKCVFRVAENGNVGCEKQAGCQFECLLYSVPKDKPNPVRTDWNLEGVFGPGGLKPDPSRYYFCRCGEL